MKAIQFHEYGDPAVLRYEDVEVPAPGAGEVRIKVAATTFNGIDANIRAGFMQDPMPLTLPHVPGIDVAGVVDGLGADVSGIEIGTEVVGFLPFTANGAAAEYVVAPAEVLARAPKTVPLADTAALPSVALTAWQALFVHARLETGQRVLINGASGAVGGYAVQLAHAAGAHVIATASPRASDLVTQQGADEVIDHTTTDVGASVGEPVDVMLNLAPIDPAAFQDLVRVVRDGGVVVSTTVWMPTPGDADRGVRAIDLYVDSDRDQLTELVARVDRGELTIDIAQRVALSELPSVHEAAAAGTLRGKVVVLPNAG